MTDRVLITLVVSGLIVEAAAIISGFTSIGWRWPLVGAGILVSLGSLLVPVLDGGKLDGQILAFIVFSVVVLGLAVGHAFSKHPAIAWTLGVGVTLQTLGLALVLAFVLTFKFGRLF